MKTKKINIFKNPVLVIEIHPRANFLLNNKELFIEDFEDRNHIKIEGLFKFIGAYKDITEEDVIELLDKNENGEYKNYGSKNKIDRWALDSFISGVEEQIKTFDLNNSYFFIENINS